MVIHQMLQAISRKDCRFAFVADFPGQFFRYRRKIHSGFFEIIAVEAAWRSQLKVIS